jgi:hypothetical protein
MIKLSEQNGAQLPSIGSNWITLAAMVIVGALALFSLYTGFQAYSSGEVQTALYYILMGVSGFAAIGYMLFRGRPSSDEKLEVKEVEVLTTIECPQCKLKRVREFQKGDYLFKSDLPCTRCEGIATITRIHQKKKEPDRRRRGLFGTIRREQSSENL